MPGHDDEYAAENNNPSQYYYCNSVYGGMLYVWIKVRKNIKNRNKFKSFTFSSFLQKTWGLELFLHIEGNYSHFPKV